MALTPAQIQTLKAAILAETDAEFVALRSAGATGAMGEWYNVAINPVQKAWITNQPPQATDDAPSYSTFDSIAAGKRDSWGFFLSYPRDFTRAKIRAWVTDVWGNATAASNAEAILQAATRNATRGEIVFGGTTRTTGTVAALDLNRVGTLSNEDIVLAVNA